MLRIYFKTLKTTEYEDDYEIIVNKDKMTLFNDVFRVPKHDNPVAVFRGEYISNFKTGPECIYILYTKSKSRYLYKTASALMQEMGITEFKVYYNNNLLKGVEL